MEKEKGKGKGKVLFIMYTMKFLGNLACMIPSQAEHEKVNKLRNPVVPAEFLCMHCKTIAIVVCHFPLLVQV